MTVNFEAVDGLVVDANDDLIWLDDDGELRVGTTDGNPLNQITWADPQSVANFNSNRCETIRVDHVPVGGGSTGGMVSGQTPDLTGRSDRVRNGSKRRPPDTDRDCIPIAVCPSTFRT